MAQKRFNNVTPAKFEALRGVLRAKGISVPDGNSGRITVPKPKVVMDFTYDGVDALDLNMISVDRTFGLPTDDMVWGQIQKGLDSIN